MRRVQSALCLFSHRFITLNEGENMVMVSSGLFTRNTNVKVFKKNLEDISPFYGATDTPFLDF